jgi:hypothetical protein
VDHPCIHPSAMTGRGQSGLAVAKVAPSATSDTREDRAFVIGQFDPSSLPPIRPGQVRMGRRCNVHSASGHLRVVRPHPGSKHRVALSRLRENLSSRMHQSPNLQASAGKWFPEPERLATPNSVTIDLDEPVHLTAGESCSELSCRRSQPRPRAPRSDWKGCPRPAGLHVRRSLVLLAENATIVSIADMVKRPFLDGSWRLDMI